VAVCAVLTLAATGCGGKKESEVDKPIAPEEMQQGRAPAPPPVPQTPSQPRTLAVPEGANSDQVLQQLNRDLMRWIVGHRRVPSSFEEFVSSAQITVPPPPAGKRYVIGKDKKIVLQ